MGGGIVVERVLFAAFLVMLSEPAFAYIDPGTGSVVTTAILGAFGALAYTFRKYMYRVKDFFSGSRRPGESQKDGSLDQ